MDANREDSLENSDAQDSCDESGDDENSLTSTMSEDSKMNEDVEGTINNESNEKMSSQDAEDSLMDKIESDDERSIDKILQSSDGQSENNSEKFGEDDHWQLSENVDDIGDDNSIQAEIKLRKEEREINTVQDELINEASEDDKMLLEKKAELEAVLKTVEMKLETKSSSENLKKEISKNVEDQEGELDFEEEVNEERKDESEMDERQIIDKENSKNESEEVKEKHLEGDDDGELEDDDDLEEGEVKDTSVRKVPNKPVCRFYNKGQCTWGSACRFIHPGVNDRGNYNMFSLSKPLVPSNNLGISGGGIIPGPLGRGPAGWRGPPDVMIPPILADDAPPVESAWERGLRHAKENLKKANRRKEMEPDFEEKRLNLSLGASECSSEFEKENDFYCKSPYKKTAEPVFTYGYDDPDPLDRQAQEYWRGGNYENFEVRYLRNDYDYRTDGKDKDKDKDRSRRDKYEKARMQDHNWRDNRYAEVQVNTRGRDDEWKDPWRRSTSPKRGGRSKSYSSASSASSCTSGSSHSSYSSHSRSSSASSFTSGSSHSFNQNRPRPRPQSRKNRTSVANSGSTSNINASSKKKSAQFPAQSLPKPPRIADKKVPSPPPPLMPQTSMEKKKKPSDKQTLPPALKTKRPRSPSSGSSTSRSRSRNSSKGSISSRSSSRTSSVSSASDYERKANGINRKQEKGIKTTKDKTKGKNRNASKKFTEERGANDHERKTDQPFDSRVKSAVSSTRGSKDPLKQSGLKPQIKLTLLNKQQPDKGSSTVPKKESTNVVKAKPVPEKDSKFSMKIPMSASKAKALALSKPDSKVFGEKNMDDSTPDSEPEDLIIKQPQQNPLSVSTGAITTTINTITTSISGKKRPATPPSPPRQNMPAPHKIPPIVTASNKAGASGSMKKNTVSRREELLKQLKAVEDAIARKRAKLS